MAVTKTLEGVLALTAGVFIFSIQDAILKGLSGDYAVTQAMFIRAAVAFPILLVFVQCERGLGALVTRRLWPMLGRGVLLLSAYTTYYMAFPALPLATAVALFFVVPLLITLLAAIFLGEKISVRTIFAIALGFAGVVVVTMPTEGLFEPAVLLSLFSALLYAAAMILARKLGETEGATVMAFHMNWVYLLAAALAAVVFKSLGISHAAHPSLDFLVRPWVLPAPGDLALLGACGVIAAVAMSLLTHAYKSAEANIVTVFEYTGLIWAPLWGYLFFAETPTLRAGIGIVMIVGAGLLVLLKKAPIRP